MDKKTESVLHKIGKRLSNIKPIFHPHPNDNGLLAKIIRQTFADYGEQQEKRKDKRWTALT